MKTRKPATLEDVARHARVSTATASRVLRHSGPVSDDLRKRIEQSIAVLDYRPQRTAKPRSHGTIALLVEDLLNPYFPEIIRGVQDGASDYGIHLTLYSLIDHPARPQLPFERIGKPAIEGIIVTGTAPFHELLEWRDRHQVPLVIINRQVSQRGVHCIKVDFENAMVRATQHLLNLGHTRIGHLASPVSGEIAESRIRGIETALREARLALPSEWCPVVSPGAEVEGGYQAMRVLLDLPPDHRPTAVLAFNDIIAVGALHAVRACGLRVPQDISIIGVDDISIAAHVDPPLTTIGQPKYRMGKLAVQTLRQMQEGKMPLGNNCTLLESPLIVRESSGPAPQIHTSPNR